MSDCIRQNQPLRMSVEDILVEFKGRRAALVKALTADLKQFHDWSNNLDGDDALKYCLCGMPDGKWVLVLPENIQPQLSLPVSGVMYLKVHMKHFPWLIFVAHSCDVWLKNIASHFEHSLPSAQHKKTLMAEIEKLPSVSSLFRQATEILAIHYRTDRGEVRHSWTSIHQIPGLSVLFDLGVALVFDQEGVVNRELARQVRENIGTSPFEAWRDDPSEKPAEVVDVDGVIAEYGIGIPPGDTDVRILWKSFKHNAFKQLIPSEADDNVNHAAADGARCWSHFRTKFFHVVHVVIYGSQPGRVH